MSKYEKEDPAFVKKMIKSFYVDGLVSGDNSRDEAYALFKKDSDRMAQVKFNLRKWLTNDAQLRDKVSKANDA